MIKVHYFRQQHMRRSASSIEKKRSSRLRDIVMHPSRTGRPKRDQDTETDSSAAMPRSHPMAPHALDTSSTGSTRSVASAVHSFAATAVTANPEASELLVAGAGDKKGPPDHPFDHMEGVDLPDYVKTHDTHLTFPEKLMLMLMHIEHEFNTRGKQTQDAPIAWTMQGKAFVIRDRDELIDRWLPLFFRHAKFPSFTRKLYRWGFRQISTPRGFDASNDRDLYFFNPHFQKHNKTLMSKMSSVTAETKRQQQRREAFGEAESTATPMTLAQYPFAETKDQQTEATHLAQPSAQQTQAALTLNRSLNTALASQLAGPGLFGAPHQTVSGLHAEAPQAFAIGSLDPSTTHAIALSALGSQTSANPEASPLPLLQQAQVLAQLPPAPATAGAQILAQLPPAPASTPATVQSAHILAQLPPAPATVQSAQILAQLSPTPATVQPAQILAQLPPAPATLQPSTIVQQQLSSLELQILAQSQQQPQAPASVVRLQPLSGFSGITGGAASGATSAPAVGQADNSAALEELILRYGSSNLPALRRAMDDANNKDPQAPGPSPG